MKPLHFGIIGTGAIAGDFTEALQRSKRCRVVSVAGSSEAKSRAFARRFGLPRAAASLSSLLGDDEVEAVYVATPHPLHEPQALACIEAGKHVLCEKPLTMDAASAERVMRAAEKRGVLLMEAFMYRCHPQLIALTERLQSGVIGELRHVRADFGFRAPRDAKGRLFDLALGGGGILDVGGYPVSLARLLAGLVIGRPFAEPVRVQAVGFVGPTGADELSSALLEFESGFSAMVTSAVHHLVGTHVVIFGELGKVTLPDPWLPQSSRPSGETSFVVERYGQPSETVSVQSALSAYAIEADVMANTLPGLEPAWPAMSHADTLGNMRALDAWRAELARSRSAPPR